MAQVGDYDIYEELGSGAFGTVFKVKRFGKGRYLAMKQIPLEGSTDVERELESQEAIPRCKNVVSLVDSFFTVDSLYLVMDYCNSGTLNDYVLTNNVHKKRITAFMRDMLNGLVHLHDNGIVHRDIKPDNVMLHTKSGNRPICKLSDFGLARFSDSTSSQPYYGSTYYLQTAVGTPYFIAPEVLTQHYTDLCDVFSLGVVFFAIQADPQEVVGDTLVATVDGLNPFYLATDEQIGLRVGWGVEDKAVADCIKDMLQKNYRMRITSQELQENFNMATLWAAQAE